MKPSTRASPSQTGSKRGSEERKEVSPAPAKHRFRVLLFACSPIEAQKALRFGERMEMAFLPSYDIEEIRREIVRFKPKLITCRADVFLGAFSSSPSAGLTGGRNQPSEAGSPGDITTAPGTPRETKILNLLAQGKTNNEMARVLRLSARTVKRTLSNLCERLGASNRTELSSRAATLCLPKKDA